MVEIHLRHDRPKLMWGHNPIEIQKRSQLNERQRGDVTRKGRSEPGLSELRSMEHGEGVGGCPASVAYGSRTQEQAWGCWWWWHRLGCTDDLLQCTYYIFLELLSLMAHSLDLYLTLLQLLFISLSIPISFGIDTIVICYPSQFLLLSSRIS